MKKNKKSVAFLLAGVMAFSFSTAQAWGGRVVSGEGDGDTSVKKPEDLTMAQKPKTFLDTVRGWIGKKPTKGVEAKQLGVKNDGTTVVVGEGTDTDGV